MASRRLILPALVRGPVRMPADSTPNSSLGATTKRRPRVMLALAWLALCVGLYLIGNLPRRQSNPAPTTGEPGIASEQSTTPRSARTGHAANAPAAATAPLPLASPAMPQPTTGPAQGQLKPVRDKSNLAVFGNGLERPADLGGPDFEPELDAPTGSTSPDDQN